MGEGAPVSLVLCGEEGEGEGEGGRGEGEMGALGAGRG